MRESDLWSLPACARIARWDVEFMEKRRASPACTESNFWGALSLLPMGLRGPSDGRSERPSDVPSQPDAARIAQMRNADAMKLHDGDYPDKGVHQNYGWVRM